MFSRNKKYILDGGTGQTLLEKGLKPEGTLWSATALINEDFHDLVVETHLDFINAGADLIVTNNFGVRKRRLLQNNRLDYFESANKFAGQLARKAKELSNKYILIAGSLPTHADTYQSRFFNTDEEVHQGFYETAAILNPFVDLFYLDVISSVKETRIACEAIKNFNKPVLIGLHFRKNAHLPSNETIADVVKEIKNYNCCGIIAACVSPEIAKLVLPEFQKQNITYGFKVNAFKNIPEDFVISSKSSSQPTDVLGTLENFTPNIFKNFVESTANQGASLLGGCCEVKPRHIKALKELRLT